MQKLAGKRKRKPNSAQLFQIKLSLQAPVKSKSPDYLLKLFSSTHYYVKSDKILEAGAKLIHVTDLTCLSHLRSLLGWGTFKPKDSMEDQLKAQGTVGLFGIM